MNVNEAEWKSKPKWNMKHEHFSTGTCFFVVTWKTHCNASRRHCNEMHIHFPIMTSPIKLHCHCKLPWALRRSNFSWILLNYSRCYSSPWTHTRPPTVTVLEMSTPFFILAEFHEQILDNYSSGRKFVSIFRSFAYFRFVLERPLQISVDSFASPCFFFFHLFRHFQLCSMLLYFVPITTLLQLEMNVGKKTRYSMKWCTE